MKTILLTLIVLSSTAFASSTPKCPAGSTTVLKCKAADQAFDQVVALNFMDGAVICSIRGELGMIMCLPESNSPSELIPVKEIVRPGATAYVSTQGDVEFSLQRMIVMNKVNANFQILLGGMRASRSLSCK